MKGRSRLPAARTPRWHVRGPEPSGSSIYNLFLGCAGEGGCYRNRARGWLPERRGKK